MKKKKKKPSNTQQRTGGRAKQTKSSPPGTAPAAPSEPSIQQEVSDGIWRLPTRMELLACLTAIHGPSPIDTRDTGFAELIDQAFSLYFSIENSLYHFERNRGHPMMQAMQSVGISMDTAEFLRDVTGLRSKRDAKAAFERWQSTEDCRRFGLPNNLFELKRINLSKGALEYLREDYRAFSAFDRSTKNVDNVMMRECYALVRKVTGLRDKDEVKTTFEEWKRHEVGARNEFAKGDTLLEHLTTNFKPWWEAKRAGNANAKAARKLSQRAPKKS